jgi:hypothetical protein
LQHVEGALGIDYETMKNLHRLTRYRNAFQLVFCFVIMGCEFDLICFCLAFPGYWNLEQTMVKGCLVAFPAAYVMCIGAYFFFLQPEEMRANTNSAASAGMQGTGGVVQAAMNLTRRRHTKLEWYHFLPLARYILLIKSTTQDDIEGIFKVNSLSSFTLGSCQLVGMLFTIFHNDNQITGLDIFVYMNLASFVVNWLITFAYFGTNIAKTMKDSISASAYRSNVSTQMRHTVLQLLSAISKDAETAAKEALQAVDGNGLGSHRSSRSTRSEGGDYLNVLRRKLQEEIRIFRQTDIDLRYFDPIELLTMRRAIYLQNAHHFEQ